jgi:hypothetical protein
LPLSHPSLLAINQTERRVTTDRDQGGGTILTALLSLALISLVSVWLSGPVSLIINRQRATSTADATSLALMWWGQAVATQLAKMNSAELVDLAIEKFSDGTTVTVTVAVAGVAADSMASDRPHP